MPLCQAKMAGDLCCFGLNVCVQQQDLNAAQHASPRMPQSCAELRWRIQHVQQYDIQSRQHAEPKSDTSPLG